MAEGQSQLENALEVIKRRNSPRKHEDQDKGEATETDAVALR
jgi:hypothetical protein